VAQASGLRGFVLATTKAPEAEARATEPSEFHGCSILAELQSMAPAALLLKKSAT
jgi:hypothetical protein